MADDTNYIGVAMGLDVTDLKAGLSEANKQIQLANSEFKAASSVMDDWTKSTEGISAKVRQLDTVLGLQRSKLAGLNAEYNKSVDAQNRLQNEYNNAVAVYGKNSTEALNLKDSLSVLEEQTRKLEVRTNNQKAVVNNTEKEFNNYSQTLKDAEDGTIDLTEVTLKQGKAFDTAEKEASGFSSVLGGLGKGLLAVGGAIAGTVTGFFALAGATREFREDTAKLNSAFDAASLSAESASETYKTLFGAIGESDTAVEASQQIALLANSEEQAAKWAEIATGVVGTFGDALKPETFYEAANETIKLGEATGAYTQMLEQSGYSVDDFNAGLNALNTEEEKQAYMLDITNQLLGDASTAYKENAKDIIAAREAEAEFTQATADLGAIAEPIMTTLKLLAVDLLEAIKPFVGLIGEGLTEAFNGSAEGSKLLADGIGGILTMLVEKAANMIPTILNIILELVPTIVNSIIQQLPMILQLIIDLSIQVINMVTQLLPSIIDAIMDILPILINQLIKAIPQLLQAAIQLLMAIVEAIPTIISALVDALPSIISTIISTLISNLPMIIKAAVQLFMGIIKAIPQIQLELIRAIPQIITGIVGGLIDGIPDMISAGADLIGGVVKGMANPKNWLSGIKSVGKSIVNGIKGIFKIHSPSVVMEDEVGDMLGLGIGKGLIDSIPAVKKDLTQFSNFITDNLSGIKSGLSLDSNFAIAGAGVNSNSANKGNTIINAGQTINFNGNLSRKQIKQLENDNYTAIKMRLKTEGAI